MSEALYAVALLACPVGMGLMMWFVMRGSKATPSQSNPINDPELARLRAEVDQLRGQRGSTDGAAPIHPADAAVR